MLVLLLFNLGGYMLLFQFFIYQSDRSINNRINNNRYKNSDLVEVKIPVHLAIQENWSEYEPISGQVQFKDNSYNYAQLRLTRDTMYLLCVPNTDKSRLINANIIYAKQVSDIPMNKKSHTPVTKKSISENEYTYTTLLTRALIPATPIKTGYDYASPDIIKAALDVPGQPPDVASLLS